MASYSDDGKRLLVVQVTFLALAWAATLMRLGVKVCITQIHTLDDYIMYSALALYSGQGAAVLYGTVAGGLGKTVSEMNLTEIMIAFKAWYICELIYGPLAAVIRTSIGLFLLRICSKPLHKRILYVCLGTVYIFTMIYLLINVFQCSPPSYYWEQFSPSSHKGVCPNASLVPKAAIAHSVIAAVSDWTLGILPIAILWRVQIKLRKKIAVAVLLSLGMVAGAVMIVRIPHIKIYNSPLNIFMRLSMLLSGPS